MRASDRGVRVTLVLEPDPRRAGTNDAVISMLAGHGLNGGFHLYRPAPFDRGHLHAKIYVFSHPDVAWIGSFNPSGDVPEDAEVVAEIGDQDRGHNLLLPIESARLTAALRHHVEKLAGWNPAPVFLRPHSNHTIQEAGTKLYFYPRLLTYPVERSIARLKAGDRLRGAISHLKAGELTKRLAKAVGRGAKVDLLVHDTERRVPTELVEQLANDGVGIVRVSHPDDLPMHAKFLLIERAGECQAWLGSYNFNKKSRRRNAEILLRTDDPTVVAQLEDRFNQIAAMAS
jgi:hypothetical protein